MHVTLVGLGNIGSHLAPLLARMPRVSALTLVDRDVYEKDNAGQAMDRSDIGKPKAKVQAQKLRRLRPDVKIAAICDDVENVPAGRLQGDVLLAAVDTRITRQYLSQICWSLGMPWIDSGVNAESGLVSISTYTPGEDNACIECGWSERHYATLEVRFACASNLPIARTNAPASLGGLAGALLGIECEKVLGGMRAESLVGRQVVYETRWHRHHVIKRRRNLRCRFDHHTLPVSTALLVFHGAPLAEVFAMTDVKEPRLTVVGLRGFAMNAICPNCERQYPNVWRFARSLRCPHCKQRLVVSGFDTAVELKEAELPAAVLRRPLHRLGLQAGDILLLHNGESEECIRVRGVDG